MHLNEVMERVVEALSEYGSNETSKFWELWAVYECTGDMTKNHRLLLADYRYRHFNLDRSWRNNRHRIKGKWTYQTLGISFDRWGPKKKSYTCTLTQERRRKDGDCTCTEGSLT